MIRYTTEGKLELESRCLEIESAVILWVKDSNYVTIRQGNNKSIVLDKSMLLQLEENGAVIANDLLPNKDRPVKA
jgi:hypothetical protein